MVTNSPATTGAATAATSYDPEDVLRRGTLLYHFLGFLGHPIHYIRVLRKTEDATPFRPVPFTAPLLFSLVITLLVLLLRIPIGNQPDWAAIWIGYIGVMTFLAFYVPELIIRKVFDFINAYNDPKWVQMWKTPALWDEMTAAKSRWRWLEVISTVGMAIASAVTFMIVFRQTLGQWPGLPELAIVLMVAVLGTVWGDGIIVAVITSSVFTRYVNRMRDELPIYSLNPQKSTVIDHISRIFETVLFTSSTALVVLLIGLLLTYQGSAMILIEGAVTIAGFGQLIGIFVFAQWTLNRIVSRRQAMVVDQLQRQIEERYGEMQWKPLDKDKLGEMTSLMGIHDKLVDTRGWGINATRLSYYLRAFVLPIGTIILSRTETKGLLDAIGKFLSGGS